MKNSVWAVAVAAVLTAGLCAPRALAGEDKKDDGPRVEWAAKMKKHMQEKLELTDDQSAKLEAAFKSSREAMKPLMERARAAHKKLAELVKGKGSDADIAAALKDSDAARKALVDEHRKLETSLSSFLKPRQLAKLQLQRERMMRRGGMGRRGHGRGGRCGGRSERRHHRWGGEKRDKDGDDGE